MSEIATLHNPFMRWLDEQGIEYIRARSDRESTLEVGWCDFTVLFPNRGPLLIEFKTKEGKESPEQKEVRERLVSKGFRVFVIRDLNVAIETVKQWQGDIETPRPAVGVSLTIRRRGEAGDFLWNGKEWGRKAVISDHAIYPRS